MGLKVLFLRLLDDPVTHPSYYLDISRRQGLSAESCPNLREVFLGVTRSPGPMLESFLDSITSPKLSTITFEFIWDEHSGDDISRIIDFEVWGGIDETLCALVGRLPTHSSSNPLSVVLSVRTKAGTNLENVKMGAFLEKFRERSTVRMVPFKGFLQPVCPYSPLGEMCDLTGHFS